MSLTAPEATVVGAFVGAFSALAVNFGVKLWELSRSMTDKRRMVINDLRELDEWLGRTVTDGYYLQPKIDAIKERLVTAVLTSGDLRRAFSTEKQYDCVVGAVQAIEQATLNLKPSDYEGDPADNHLRVAAARGVFGDANLKVTAALASLR